MLWKLLFAWSYKTKIVVGGRKIKQLDFQSLSCEGFGTGVFAGCMRQILFMRRSNVTASTLFEYFILRRPIGLSFIGNVCGLLRTKIFHKILNQVRQTRFQVKGVTTSFLCWENTPETYKKRLRYPLTIFFICFSLSCNAYVKVTIFQV